MKEYMYLNDDTTQCFTCVGKYETFTSKVISFSFTFNKSIYFFSFIYWLTNGGHLVTYIIKCTFCCINWIFFICSIPFYFFIYSKKKKKKRATSTFEIWVVNQPILDLGGLLFPTVLSLLLLLFRLLVVFFYIFMTWYFGHSVCHMIFMWYLCRRVCRFIVYIITQ